MEHVKQIEDFRSKIISEVNLCRKNPTEYAKKLHRYQTYFKGKILKVPDAIPQSTTEGPTAFEEAVGVLEITPPLEALKYSPGLTYIAHDSLKYIQKVDEVEEINKLDIDKQIEKHGQVVGHFSQATEFGSNIAELVVINLLVDDGDTKRRHRQNLLSDKFRLIGVSTGIHMLYQYCTVLVFAQNFFGNYENYSDYANISKTVDEVRRKSFSEYSQLNKSGLMLRDDRSNADKSFVRFNIADEIDLPKGVSKIERFEKFVLEDGVRRKVIKIVKHLDDGATETECYREQA
jgi:hypothetical protein